LSGNNKLAGVPVFPVNFLRFGFLRETESPTKIDDTVIFISFDGAYSYGTIIGNVFYIGNETYR